MQLIQTPLYWLQANNEVENRKRSILKRLQIVHAIDKDYQTDIQTFIGIYIATPHGTANKYLSEALFGSNIREKISVIYDLINIEKVKKSKTTKL